MAKRQKESQIELSRRERQIMDIIYVAEVASAAEVLEVIPNPPSYSTIRKLLSILVEKGHLKTSQQGTKYLYRPTKPRGKAGQSALARVLETFYEGSLEKAVAAMLRGRDAKLSDAELASLSKLIDDARKESS